MADLKGRVAVVSGGAGGIGSAIAEGLAKAGAQVVIFGRSIATLEETAAEIRKNTGAEVAALTADVTNEESVAELAKKVVAKFGKVDILVNAHGFNIKSPAEEFPMDDFRRLFEANVTGTMINCKTFGKIMIQNQYGKIINLSSVRGVRANAGGNAAYASSKAAVDMITRSLAAEWAKHHINVNAIGPALVATKLTEKQMQEPGRTAKYLTNIPWGRLGKPEDFVGITVLLASDEADFMTGQIVYIDGGLTAIG